MTELKYRVFREINVFRNCCKGKRFLVDFSLLMIIIISVTLQGCHPDSDAVTISGVLGNADGLMLKVSEMDPQAMIPLDSVTLKKDGHFQITFKASEPGFYVLEAMNGKIVVLLIKPGDNITIRGSADIFPDDIIIEGPEEAMELHQFFTETRHLEKTIDSVEQVLTNHQDADNYFEITSEADTLLGKIWEEQRAREIRYIKKNSSKLSSLVVINYAFGATPTLSMEEDFNYYLLLDSTLSASFPDNKHVKFHKQRMVSFIPPKP
jgi:hypothetical protein